MSWLSVGGPGWLAGLVGRLLITGGLIACGLIGCDADRQAGQADKIQAPTPRRVVTLAPHLTELVFAAGAGDRLVGAVEYSDFPTAARDVPRIGDSFRLDYEAIASLQPDLILAWQGGNPADVIERLRDLEYRVLALDAASLESVGQNLRQIGAVLGTRDVAEHVAGQFDTDLLAVRTRYANAEPVKVFYQVSWEPLFTISDRHVIGQAIRLCGGRNVFGGLEGLSPAVSLEAVLKERPDAIIASDFGEARAEAATRLSGWAEWEYLPAVRHGNLYFVDADYMVRPGSRIIEGVRQLCDRLDRARGRLMRED